MKAIISANLKKPEHDPVINSLGDKLRYFLMGVSAVSNNIGAVLVEHCEGNSFRIIGTYENLLHLTTNTGGSGEIFSFRDVAYNKPGEMTFVISESGMSLEQVISAIEAA